MAQAQTAGPQFDASVNSQTYPPIVTSGGNLEDATQRIAGILGTSVDTGATSFPTVPSSFDANHHYYPGLSRSYLAAAVVETPMHRQIRYATQDIPSVQLTIRGPISPQVLQRWQLSQISAGTIIP